MNFASEPEEATEAHHQGPPAHGIDVAAVFGEQVFPNMELHDVNLEGVGAHVLPKGAHVVHDSFHLDRTFTNPGGGHVERTLGCESGETELVGLVAMGARLGERSGLRVLIRATGAPKQRMAGSIALRIGRA